jgi:hypothetical protein
MGGGPIRARPPLITALRDRPHAQAPFDHDQPES